MGEEGNTDCSSSLQPFTEELFMKRIGFGMCFALMIGCVLGISQGTLMGSESVFLDAIHALQGVDCAGCHEVEKPAEGAEVENDRCLGCHGRIEDLVAKTAPEKFPDRNPHQSHLGAIGCTVCHHGHMASEVYCLGCHKNFDMKIPGSGI